MPSYAWFPAALLSSLALGCSGSMSAPPALETLDAPEALFLVRNEVFSIRFDGTARRSLGKVGDDRHRTAYPRFLPDGRVALLANDTGAIFPYVGTLAGNDFVQLPKMNVSVNDSLCGVTMNGETRLVFSASPTRQLLPTFNRLYRTDPSEPKLTIVARTSNGALTDPSPYDDGRVLAVRSANRLTEEQVGDVTIEVINIAMPSEPATVLATVMRGYYAVSPARLDDGRVVFIRRMLDGYSDRDLGEIFVIELDGTVHTTTITGAIGLVTRGRFVVYETGGSDGVTDLVVTDLLNPPRNVTSSPYVAEHLTWSD